MQPTFIVRLSMAVCLLSLFITAVLSTPSSSKSNSESNARVARSTFSDSDEELVKYCADFCSNHQAFTKRAYLKGFVHGRSTDEDSEVEDTSDDLEKRFVHEDHIDDNYEPTDEELHEYATYIGIDIEKESDLLWLAKEGFMKPLPSGWKACQEENGELYYFNFDTGKSSWDHPYDEIYKARVIQAREKKSLATVMIDSHSRGKNTLSISELSSEKHVYNVKNETSDHHDDSENIHNSESEMELNHSDNGPEHNSNDFGIDRQISACIDHEQNEASELPTISDVIGVHENNKDSTERARVANLAAEAAERRRETNKAPVEESTFITPREDLEITKLRTRLEQSINEEKLELLEENRIQMEKVKAELESTKQQQERALRDQMKSELTLTEKTLREKLEQEKKLLISRHQNDLIVLKQSIEKEKQDLQKKLRADMLSDLNLEQQDNVNMQIRLLQVKHEFEEKLRNAENRYKNEIEDLTRRFEKVKSEKDTVEKRLKEKNQFCLTIQRTLDQLRGEKFSLERQLHDAEFELKTIDSIHRQKQKSTSSRVDNDENSKTEQTFSHIPSASLHNEEEHDDDDDEGLSDTDSDIIEMKQTLNALKHMSFLPTPTDPNHDKPRPKSSTINFTTITKQDTSPITRNIPFERTPNSSFIDSGRWSSTMPTKTNNNTYPIGVQALPNSPSMSKTTYWQSQPSLITREAVLKAARDVLPPGVIDHLT
ncbi:unnamed protein product, partial [Adineta ricciae]